MQPERFWWHHIIYNVNFQVNFYKIDPKNWHQFFSQLFMKIDIIMEQLALKPEKSSQFSAKLDICCQFSLKIDIQIDILGCQFWGQFCKNWHENWHGLVQRSYLTNLWGLTSTWPMSFWGSFFWILTSEFIWWGTCVLSTGAEVNTTLQ